jgi:hypothetical protein
MAYRPRFAGGPAKQRAEIEKRTSAHWLRLVDIGASSSASKSVDADGVPWS